VSDIKFQATVDSKSGEVSLSQLDKGVDKLGTSTQKSAGAFKTLAAGVAAGVAAFYAAAKALRGLIKWMGDAIEKAGIQQMAEKEVAAALESTGREVFKNTEHFKEYASRLQQATVFGDEQILSAQALMVQLTKLDREGLDMATKGAIGLASVYKQDLQAATTLVGKALAGNYGALSRYGIMVDRTATDEEKRASVLRQLQIMYQRAEAETDTYQGSVKQLSNTYGDLKEKAGDAVIKNEELLGLIKTATQAIRDFIDAGYPEHLAAMAAEVSKNAQYFVPFADSLAIIAAKLHLDATKARVFAEEQKRIKEGFDLMLVGLLPWTAATKESADVLYDWQIEAKKITPLELYKPEIIETADDFTAALKRQREELDPLGLSLMEAVEDCKELTLAWQQFELETEDTYAKVMESLGFFVRETEDAGDATKEMAAKHKAGMEATWAATKQIGSAIALKNKDVAYAMAVINTAEAVTKALTGAIPPWNIALAAISFAAGAAQMAIIQKQSIPTAARGAYLPSETFIEAGHGAHGELVLRPEQLPQVVKEIIREPFAGAGGVNITIVVQDQLDPYTAQRITREQIIPQILESLDINENKKKWQERLG